MAKTKSKVSDRRKAQPHSAKRRSGGGGGGGGGGGALGGLRGGFRSLVGTGGRKKGSGEESRFWTVMTWLLLAGAVAVLVGRYAC